MVLQNYQNLIKMTLNTNSIVAFSGGLKCPRKIYFNTQWGRGAVFLPNWRRCRGGKTSIAMSVKGAPRCCLDQPTTSDSGCNKASIKLRHWNTNFNTCGNILVKKPDPQIVQYFVVKSRLFKIEAIFLAFNFNKVQVLVNWPIFHSFFDIT